jgi:hypothetical protein
MAVYMAILVTGGLGFIGSHTVVQLINSGESRHRIHGNARRQARGAFKVNYHTLIMDIKKLIVSCFNSLILLGIGELTPLSKSSLMPVITLCN